VQLTVRDVSKCLNVSESTVTRWIKQRGLPAQKVAGQHRFNRAEVLEWAIGNQLKIAPDLFDQLPADENLIPTLSEALAEGGIYHQLDGTNKEEALRALVQVLPLPSGVDREFVLHLILAREASASTAVGDGFAIPHVRNPIVLQVGRPMVTLAFLAQPVDFGAQDGKPVHVLFSIISPTTQSHLQLLSRLSVSLHDVDFRATLLRHAPREEILREVRRVESGLAGPPSRIEKWRHPET
jgi:PTS system nitrogen regulatory IIA component